MKLVDVNLLLYAVNESAPQHRKARAWLEGALSSTETVAFPWVVVLAFLRLSTRALVFPRPLTPEQAFAVVERWTAQPCVSLLEPTESHLKVMRDMLLPLGTAGNLTTDAHLAALAVEHGAELCSSDSDFSRFPGVRWTNPLA